MLPTNSQFTRTLSEARRDEARHARRGSNREPEGAAISFSNTVEIARRPDEVYAYLSDLKHTPEWNWAITSTEKVTPGPVSIGTRYRQTRSVPKPRTESLEITRLDGGSTIEVTGMLAGFPARLTYELDKTRSGTRLTNEVHLETKPALRILAPLLGRRIKTAVGENLQQLKSILEESAVQV